MSKKVSFEAEIGSGVSHAADVALDDIVISEGVCPTPKPPPTPNPCLRMCKDGSCVPSDKVCDFYPDCAQRSDPTDESDESGCDGCDFEDGVCGWNDTGKGIFKWMRQRGKTASWRTGPSKDHTKQTVSGYYMYVEASRGNNYDLATFASPTIKQASATCELNFWYHMYGRSIGELKVYIVYGYRMTLLWKINGDQGNKWRYSFVHIPRQVNPFRVEFVASRIGWRGDIAIDDVSLTNCALPKPAKYCNDMYNFRCSKTRACINYRQRCDFQDDCGDGSDEENCARRHYPSRCNFEYSLCSWQQLEDDDFDFTRAKGSTESTGTGPLIDHTTGTAFGYYLYAEASLPRKKGDKARIGSSLWMATNVNSECSVRFYYHMRGSHIGSLRLKTRHCTECDDELTLWERTISNGDYWFRQAVQLSSKRPFQVVFEAEIGNGFSGDIAIDDISFSGCRIYYGVLPTALPTTPAISTTSPCLAGQFFCAADGKCIASMLKCDYRNDCSDGQDEFGCGACSFERDMCGYTDGSPGEYKFKRVQPYDDGKSPIPKYDNRNNTKGYFVMTTAGIGTRGMRAIIRSPSLPPTSPQCKLQFTFYSPSKSAIIYVNTEEDYKNETVNSVLIYQRANTAGVWTSMQIGLGSRPQGWQLWFQSTSEFFAIDDIQMKDCAFPLRTGVCNFMQVGCDNGACIDPDQICNFANDCGDWSDEKPEICSASYNERCNFERDLCNWYQDKDDDFDWKRSQGQTSSLFSGPWSDHTVGNRKGYYMYIESSWPRRPNDTARLYSAVFKPSKACTMRFYYHMYGINVDTLYVWLKTTDDMNSPKTLLWSQTGDKGNFWFSSFVFINSKGRNFQVVFEGKRGDGFMGDISIDDVSFAGDCIVDLTGTLDPYPYTPSPPPGCKSGEFSCRNGECVPVEAVCNFKPECSNNYDESFCPSKCNFEDKDDPMCKWHNLWFTDLLDWKVHQGFVSNGSGPQKDNTNKSQKGHYLYMETSKRQEASGPYAHLISPMYYNGAHDCTFNFYYNIWRSDINTRGQAKLNIYYMKEGRQTLIWDREDNIYNKWTKASVRLPSCPKDFKLVLEGQGLGNTKTDVAIDDWSFDCVDPKIKQCLSGSQFTCAKTKQCISLDDMCDNERNCCDGSDESADVCQGYTKYDWQDGFNGWTQLHGDNFDFSIYSGSAPEWYTGPKTDHTTGEVHGRYVYADTSSKAAGDTAMIGSPVISPIKTSQKCKMTFWYNMRGTNVGTLSVYTAKKYGVKENVLWSLSGEQGYVWKKAALVLNSDSYFQVIFEVKVGSQYRGDIGLDDVVFSPECKMTGLIPGGPTPPPVDPCLPKFQCVLSGKCISRHQVCDFVPDCLGDTDERFELCGNPQSFENSSKPWTDSYDVSYHFTLQTGTLPSSVNALRLKRDATGNPKGHYAYLDAKKKSKNHKARLVTPTFGAAYSDCMMEFSYYMYGKNTGVFMVDLITVSNSTNDPTRLFERAGSQTSRWIKTQVYIGRRKEPFYLNFTVSVGGNPNGMDQNFGDIAFDEVSFKNCGHQPVCSGNLSGKFICSNARCVPEDKTCDMTDDCGDGSDEKASCYNFIGCNFEDAEMDPCNMTQATDDDFDWYLHSGYTNSYNTGPTRDHTLGTSGGHYYYIEASNPRKKGDTARMFSLPIQAKVGGKCTLRFYYHMFGKDVGDLLVYTTKENMPKSLKFRALGNKGEMWKMATVDLSNEVGIFRLMFEGIVGKSFSSDIAIDDIILNPDCQTNSSRIFPTVTPCSSSQFRCQSSGQCLSKALKCDGHKDCKDGSDETKCPEIVKFKDGKKKSTGVLAAAIVGGMVALLVLMMVVYLIVKRKRDKKLHLFSVFYDPTKQPENGTRNSQQLKEAQSSITMKSEGLSNPVYNEQSMSNIVVSDLNTDMFPDTAFQIETQTKGGATSMANPLYQDPYMEDDDSPLSNF